MCYQVEVLELNNDQAIITVGESKFIAYHDTDVIVEEGFDDCWSYSRECHYTRKKATVIKSNSLMMIRTCHSDVIKKPLN